MYLSLLWWLLYAICGEGLGYHFEWFAQHLTAQKC